MEVKSCHRRGNIICVKIRAGKLSLLTENYNSHSLWNYHINFMMVKQETIITDKENLEICNYDFVQLDIEKCRQFMPNISHVLHFLMVLVDLAFTFAEICMRYTLALGKREKTCVSVIKSKPTTSREHGKLVPWGQRVFLKDVRDVTSGKTIFLLLECPLLSI